MHSDTAARNTNRYTPAIRFAILRIVAKKAKLMRAYRLPEKVVFEIERLSEEWECTQAEVIERAIAALNTPQARTRDVSELKVEYD